MNFLSNLTFLIMATTTMRFFYYIRKPLGTFFIITMLMIPAISVRADIGTLQSTETVMQSDSVSTQNKVPHETKNDKTASSETKEVKQTESYINFDVVLYLLYKYIKINTAGSSR